MNSLYSAFEKISQACAQIGEAINNALLSIHPNDLLPALVEMTEADKQVLLDYYKQHEMYQHCSVIYKMMDVYNDDPVHEQ